MFQRKTEKRVLLSINPPSQVDGAASTASQESHVSPPVIILPLDQQLVDANLGLEELQTFQHVDNVVELQLQPVPPPPPPPGPPLFLLMHHFLTRLIL